MVSLLNVSVIGFFLFIIVIVQAEPLLKSTNDVDENKSAVNNQQLYELYKIMRTDPRFATVSNKDIVSYIYQTYVLGKGGDEIDLLQPKFQKHRRHRYQKAV